MIEELVQGSSLICQDELERGGERYIFRMHRLVRRFIVIEMECGSELWKEVFNLALVTMHESVKIVLENEGKSLKELPKVFESNHDEFVAHALALVDYHVIPKRSDKIPHVSKVEDIHQYNGEALHIIGKAEEEIRIWERLIDVLRHREAINRSYAERLRGKWCRRNRGKELKFQTANVFNSLGLALLENGKLNDAASTLEQSLQMKLAIVRYDKPHSAIATSLNNLGIVY